MDAILPPETIAWKAWRYWARFWGLVAAAMVIGLPLVYLTSNGAVWTAKNLHVLTPEVRVGEKLRYTMDVIAHQSCPGRYAWVIASLKRNGPPVTVSDDRQIAHPGVSKSSLYQEVDLSQHPEVDEGEWELVSDFNSQCPLDKQHDPGVRFRFKVVR